MAVVLLRRIIVLSVWLSLASLAPGFQAATKTPTAPSRKRPLGGTTLSVFSSDSFSSSSSSSNGRRRSPQSRRAKTIQDRTPDEAFRLFKDVSDAVITAGPQAGPARTFEAQRAVTATFREFFPAFLRSGTLDAPKVIRTLFERLGATYIKLGQFIASSPTIFPKEYVTEFQKCLDQTDPLPWSTIRRVIERELGPIGKTFESVDTKPLASASIAQVHRATLLSGEQVVIKVQKPGIDASLKADLGFIYVAARTLEFIQPDWERTSLSGVVGDLRSSMLEELDFTKEARNTIEFRRFLRDNDLMSEATCPRVYLDYTSQKVMTLEYLDGVSLLDDSTVSKISLDPEMGTRTIITALNVWSTSVTKMPFFHADVHAGNLLLLRDGRVAFIDFGIVGRISDKVFQAVTELSAALALGDPESMAKALCKMGAADADVDTKKFGADIERLMQRMERVEPEIMVGQMSDGTLSGSVSVDESEITNLLLEFVEVSENNGLKLPREFGLLVKQNLYFDRYLKILAPNVDIMNDARVNIGGMQRTEETPALNGEKVVIDV